MMVFLNMNIPWLAKIVNWDLMSEATNDFFRSLVLGAMKDRQLKQIIRHDMIHLLIEAKKERSLKHENGQSKGEAAVVTTYEKSTQELNRVWTDTDIVAQVIQFFVAGFETTSSAMCFLLYELALNPDIQDHLAKEIRKDYDNNGGELDFNSIQSLTYLDMVVSELLRLWPPFVALDRVCNKDYNLGKPNKICDKDFILRKGTGVMIPTFSFHRDPKYFPNPEKFDPERFSEENKHKINPFAYMPFGIGPRNCIELKAFTYQILLHMEVSPCETTPIPAKLATESFNIVLQGGHDLKFRIRT